MSKIELKPCPFCGAEAHTWFVFPHSETPWHVHVDHDDRCILRTAMDGVMCCATEEEMAETWNRRSGGEEKDGVGVKPLEWTKYGEAKGAYAKYTVYESGGSTWNAVCYPYEESHYRLAEGVSEAEAKAAACAHHSAAILSVLTNTEPSLRAENERLRKDLNGALRANEVLNLTLEEAAKVLEMVLDQAEHVCLGAHSPADIRNSAKALGAPCAAARSFLSNLKGAE